MTRHGFWFVIMLAGIVVSGTHAQISHKILIRGGRVVPVVGEPIEGGAVLIENGKITAVGKDIKAPFDAMVVDATGKVILPGLVEPYTSSGLDRANESQSVTPYLQVFDAIDPSDPYFEEALRNGITTVHIGHADACVIGGVSRVVRPIGISVDEMTVRAEGGLKIAMGPKSGNDRASQLAVLRRTFSDLDRYLERRAEELYEAKLKKDGEKLTVGPAEARKRGKDLITLAKLDDRHRNLVRLRDGSLQAYVSCPAAMDLDPALKLAKAQGYLGQTTLIVGAEAFRVARELRRAGRPVVLPVAAFVHSKLDPKTFEPKETFVPKALFDGRVEFAVAGIRRPWYEMARLVRNGVPRDVALAAMTIQSARAIGMGGRLGSIEKGKDGNLVVLSGDPLDITTWVEEVYIEGRRVYERSKDIRLRDIIQGAYDTKRSAEDKKAAAAKKAKKTDSKGDQKAPKSEKAGNDAKSKAPEKSAPKDGGKKK